MNPVLLNALTMAAVLAACLCSPAHSAFFDTHSLSAGDLQCSSSCTAAPAGPLTNANSTCLLVTLMDQFGDGWANGTDLSYWAEVSGDMSNVVHASPSCSCAVLLGCLEPFGDEADGLGDQKFFLSVTSADYDTGTVGFPAYSWEVYWTVQVVEGGTLKEKFYGGFNSSLSLTFSPSSSSYSSAHLTNMWKPPVNMSCPATMDDMFEGRIFDGVGAGHSYGNETGLYGVRDGDIGGYFESIFVITDIDVSFMV